jgi:hypothetical protein
MLALDYKEMKHEEVVENLQISFAQRVGRFAHQPFDLTGREAEELLSIAPVNILLYSFSKFGGWLQRKKSLGEHLDREHMLRGLLTAVRNAYKDDSKGRTKEAKPTVRRIDDVQVSSLREAFQDTLTDGSWCITAEEAKDLLEQNSLETLRNTFQALGRTYSEREQNDCLDLLNWRLTTAQLV